MHSMFVEGEDIIIGEFIEMPPNIKPKVELISYPSNLNFVQTTDIV